MKMLNLIIYVSLIALSQCNEQEYFAQRKQKVFCHQKPVVQDFDQITIKETFNHKAFNILVRNQKDEKYQDLVSLSLSLHGSYKEEIIGWLAEKLRKLERQNPDKQIAFIDVGSNLGVFALSVASLGYKTYAFESYNQNIQAFRSSLCENKDLMDKITLYEQALGDENTECLMYILNSNSQNPLFDCNEEEFELPDDAKFIDPVQVQSLNSLTKDFDDKILFGVMKLDAGGLEENVLRNGKIFLEEHPVRYIMLKYSDRMSGTPESLLEVIHQLGYEVRKGSPTGSVVQQADQIPSREFGNYLFLTLKKGVSEEGLVDKAQDYWQWAKDYYNYKFKQPEPQEEI